MKTKALRRTLALAAMLAIVAVFALEGFPHHHVGGLDDRECPACQAARQHVGDAPQASGVLLVSPVAGSPQTAEPAVERISAPPFVSSSSPRSPPLLSA